MATKFTKPELSVGDTMPDGFTALRGASYLAYGTVNLIYRRHFWYVFKKSVCVHIASSYKDGRDKWNELNEQWEEENNPPMTGADAVVARIMSQPTPPRQHEDW